MREDGCVMPWCPTHGAEASSSRAGLPAPDVSVARPEQDRGNAGAPPAHFDKAQAEQALWQEFRDHDASLNKVKIELEQSKDVIIFKIEGVRHPIVFIKSTYSILIKKKHIYFFCERRELYYLSNLLTNKVHHALMRINKRNPTLTRTDR
jgi:hypothetical protein